MKKLLIAGAGGCGREVYQWAIDIQQKKKEWDTIMFLDDNPKALDSYGLSDKIQGSISEYAPKEGEYIVCAIGDSKLRLSICDSLERKGAVFTNIIHPDTVLSDNHVLGKGVMLSPYSVISTNARIGDHVLINTFSVAGHDCVMEKGCTLSDHCDVMGFAVLEEGVFLGGGARILPGVRVCKYAKVGAGSVVLRKVKENITVFGNPARQIM
jgi:sugar O-acyltransferase (sialic acid O-acetyltransferase NeuD family)